MSGRALAALVCAAWLTVAPPTAAAAGRYDPRLRFRSIRTAHFTIHFHQGEERAAARLSTFVEPVRSELERRLGLAAPPHTHIVLVDQSDVANGWSTPVPYNLMELAASPPAPQSFLGNHDDWLRMVFTHEYTHTMHLDQVGGVMRIPRWVLGRHPVSFPNLFVPTWQIEGIATFAEGAAGLGRTHASDVAAVIRAQGDAGRTPRLDQLAGGLVAWPAGWGPYFYGGEFFEFLAARQGEAALGDLGRRTARRLPFFSGGAFAPLFGKNAAGLWQEFLASTPHGPDASHDRDTGARRLTHAGYLSSAPRFVRGADGDTPEVIYASSTAHEFPSIRRIRADGTGGRAIATRFLGNAMGFIGRWAVYDEVEFDGPAALTSDLYAHDPSSDRRVRLSRGERLSDPDVSKDGTRIVAAQVRDGQRSLVVLPLGKTPDGAPVLGSAPVSRLGLDGCAFATPRWSPDGRFVAAVATCDGALPEIVVYEPAVNEWFIPAPAAGARNITPAWTPDGQWLLFASDRDGSGFALFAQSWTTSEPQPVVHRILDAPGGATAPDVSPDGTLITFVSATPEGTEVFVAPFRDPASGRAPSESRAAPASQGRKAAATERAAAANEPMPDSTPYSPWSTLVPRAWQPLVTVDDERVDLGAMVSASDALGRHMYVASATWAADAPDPSPGLPAASRIDWGLSYSYDRWFPTFFVSASGTTDPVTVRLADGASPLRADSRTFELFSGVVLPLRSVRVTQAFLFGLSLEEQVIDLGARDVRRTRNALRAGWTYDSDRQYGYSISREDGFRLGMTAERTLPALGADGTSTTFTTDARGYFPGGFQHAVVAARAALGVSHGDLVSRRLFSAAGPGAALFGLSFDRAALGLLRGIPEDDLQGAAMAGANVDFRFPIARVERGRGAWPLFLNTIHGAIFADYVSVGRQLDTLGRSAWSAGLEGSADVTIGFGLRMSLTGGVAWTHDNGRESAPGQGAAFVRTGIAF